MNSSASDDSLDEISEPVSSPHERPISPDAAAHPDPLTGEPDAHPVGVGVGALSAGAAGAAVGAFLGPVGALIGAAIGAVAGGLAGKEVASGSESVESAGEDAVTTASQSSSTTEPFADEHPLPTASSGLITPDESSFFADSTDASHPEDSEMLVESPLPAAFAVSADPDTDPKTAVIKESPVYTSHLDTEHTIRTGAYYRYLGRQESNQPGDALGDWVEAEHEILHP